MLKKILDDNPPLSAENKQFQSSLIRVFNGQRNKATMYLTLVLMFSVLVFGVGYYFLAASSDIRLMLVGILLFMCGLELNVLMKLWYWVVDNKISVLKEIKTTQLMIAQLMETRENEAEPIIEEGPSAPYKEPAISFWEKYEPSTIKKISKALIIASLLIFYLVITAYCFR
jgi:hypothetical protein